MFVCWLYVDREKLMDAFKANSLGNILKTFYAKKKKVNKFFFTVFYISHECGIKTFLKWSINKCFKDTR